jgi:uncharacterized protein
MRGYDSPMRGTIDQAGGGMAGPIRVLEASNPGPFKDLLYHLELGMLLRLDGRYEESQKSWKTAAERVQPAEQSIEDDVVNLLQGASSYVVNDRLRAYPGYDYEKVMLLTHIALNYLAMGDFDQARVAIKQTHELEALIAEARSKEIAEVEEKAKKRGARTSFKELNGYPVETIDNPEVNALRNSYQSALSHYLAGFVYEALGEPSLAAPGYRLANELQPNQPLLEEALRNLDQRVGAADDGLTDVLFVIGSGAAPALQSRQFRLPVPTGKSLVMVVASFPVMAASTLSRPWSQLVFDGGPALAVAPITSIDLMARRRLSDDMPGIMLRTTVRASTRALLQAGLQQSHGSGDRQGSAVGVAAALAIAAGSLVTEKADERTWRTLPSEISIARARVPAGMHTVTLQTLEGTRSARLDLSGRYAVVDLRLLRNQLFVSAFSAHSAPETLEQKPQPRETSK